MDEVVYSAMSKDEKSGFSRGNLRKHVCWILLGIAFVVLFLSNMPRITDVMRDVTAPLMLRESVPKYNQKGPLIAFLRHLKNPCWHEQHLNISLLSYERELRCLPYFLLAGFPKSATTDLMYRITLHPDVVNAHHKEPHWWTRRLMVDAKPCRSNLITYLDEFKNISQILQGSCQIEGKGLSTSSPCGRLIVGDGSASTMWDSRDIMKELLTLLRRTGGELLCNQYLENRLDRTDLNYTVKEILKLEDYTGLPFTSADVIHSFLPGVKIVVILREPVERLYSDYNFINHLLKKSSERFDQLATKAIEEFNECLRRKTDRMCAYELFPANRVVRTQVGVYSIFIKDWLSVFPREQFLFIRTEDYAKNPRAILENVYRHLRLDPLDETAMQRTLLGMHINKSKKVHEPMFNTTRQKLSAFYTKYNRQLADLLNDESFTWSEYY